MKQIGFMTMSEKEAIVQNENAINAEGKVEIRESKVKRFLSNPTARKWVKRIGKGITYLATGAIGFTIGKKWCTAHTGNPEDYVENDEEVTENETDDE